MTLLYTRYSVLGFWFLKFIIMDKKDEGRWILLEVWTISPEVATDIVWPVLWQLASEAEMMNYLFFLAAG